jgi:hypothetical protein
LVGGNGAGFDPVEQMRKQGPRQVAALDTGMA